MSGSIIARVDHSSDNRALLLEVFCFINVVLPQVDLKIPGKEEAWVTPLALGLHLRLQMGPQWKEKIAWYTMNYLACFP